MPRRRTPRQHEAVRRLQRADQPGTDGDRHWLYPLTDLSVAEAVASPVASTTASTAGDPSAGLRAALRRRLVNATPDERVAGALVHLAGYPADFVAEVLGTTPQAALAAAAVLAPPPGVDYRELGDPTLTGTESRSTRRRGASRMRRPHWTTVAAVAVVAAAVIAATQVTGPRPTLGPPLEEGGAAAVDSAASAERRPAHPGHQRLTSAAAQRGDPVVLEGREHHDGAATTHPLAEVRELCR